VTPWGAGGIGFALAAGNLVLWRLAVARAARGVPQGGPGPAGVFLALAFLLKLPLLILVGTAVTSRGQALTTGFLIGFVSVYCATFGWVVLRTHRAS
jgi:hypothetical protein